MVAVVMPVNWTVKTADVNRLEERPSDAKRQHVDLVWIGDLEPLVLRPQAQAPDAKLGSDAIGEVGAVVARLEVEPRGTELCVPVDQPDAREQVHGSDGQKAQRRN